MKFASLLFLILFQIKIGYPKSWDFPYMHFGKNEGLPSNKIYFACKDRLGFLWIGTDAGLCKFNGSKFELFTTENGLPSNDVFELICDSKNRIWIISMSNQVAFYYHGKIHNPDNDSVLSKIVVPDRVARIIEDKDSNIWILSFPFSISKISTSNNVLIKDFSQLYGNCFKVNLSKSGISFITDVTSLFYNYRNHDILANNQRRKKYIKDFLPVNDFSYFYTDEDNVLRKGNDTLWKMQYYTNSHVLSLFKKDKCIWQLRNNGISCYQCENLNKSKLFLDDYSVSNFVDDKYDNFWVSTLYNGIYKINSQSIQVFKLHNDESSNSFHSIYVNNKFIIVGNNKGEVSILNKKRKNLFKLIRLHEKAILSVRILKILSKGNLLFICCDAGTYVYNLETNRIFPILVNQADKNLFIRNDSLIVLNNVSVSYLNKDFKKIREFIKSDRFYSHCIYKNRRLFGSENALYYESDSLIPYPLDQPFHYRLMDMTVVDSILVVATTEKGVFFINGNKIVRNLNLNNGLNSNNCSKVLSYRNELFIATNNGICRYNYHSNEMSRIMESDGLASNNVLDIALDHDTLYAGTDNGMSVIPISSLTHRQSFTFFINPIMNNGDTIWDIKKKIASRTDHLLSFVLNAITLGVKGDVRYYYRVKELDTLFKSTSEPNISLNLFNTGNFTFESYSMDVNGLKSEMATLQIDVVPYWWQTLLFKFACGLLAILFLFLIYRLMNRVIMKREKAKNELDNRIIRLELDAWKSNINPHFIFNSFNTIQSLFASSSYERANEYIANFANVLRKTIDNSGRLMNKIPEEITYLTHYLELEKMKKKHKLSFQMYFNELELRTYYIPSLLLQPIVENAIKHGIKYQQNGHIVLEFKVQSETITISVRDNGVGLSDKNKNYTNSKGLKLVRDKIRIVESITHTKIEFKMENVYDANGNCLGVVAIFIMPKYLSGDIELL